MSSNRWKAVLGGICWILSLEFFFVQAFVQSAWTGSPYSLLNSPISDLGVTSCQTVMRGMRSFYLCSPLNALMNVSFIVTGLLLLFGLYLTRTVWPRTRVMRYGLAFLVLASLGKIVVGLVPENVNPPLHYLGALGFVCSNIGLIMIGRGIWQRRRWVGELSVFLGVIGLIGAGLFIPLEVVGYGGGAAERLADYPLIIWFAVLGLNVILRSPVSEMA